MFRCADKIGVPSVILPSRVRTYISAAGWGSIKFATAEYCRSSPRIVLFECAEPPYGFCCDGDRAIMYTAINCPNTSSDFAARTHQDADFGGQSLLLRDFLQAERAGGTLREATEHSSTYYSWHCAMV